MKTKKLLALTMSALLVIGALSGCGQKKDDGKVSVSIGNQPSEGHTSYDLQMEKFETFRAAHPDIDIKPDTYQYDTKNFIAKAAANQLPTTFDTYFTEIKQIAKQGYCADISKALENTGLMEALNPTLIEMVKGENGEIWGVPHAAYAQSLTVNKKLFKEAGLVNEDGSVKVPNTYDEVAQYAKIIKEKTGKAGFVIPTIENCGGWHMMNIAWSYGTEFMKQNDDGSWTATFDSDEFKAACQWLYDMKWKYNALVDNSVVSNGERMQLFGTYQVGMMFGAPPEQDLARKYGMNVKDISCVRMPEGPAGRYAQSGGQVIMFSNTATQAQIEAALLFYMEQDGYGTVVDDAMLELEEKGIINNIEKGGIQLHKNTFPTFTNRKGEEKLNALKEKYCNVDIADWNDYLGFEGVTIRAEEPVCCQQLYAVIDVVVQKIITDKNVDIDAIVKEAVNDFQKNHLDNL